MSDPRLKLEINDAVVTLTIDRPDKLNALDAEMVAALGQICHEIEHNADIRAVILTGAGNKAFCAGGDIAAWSDTAALDFGRFWVREGHDAFAALARLRQPVIAVLAGHCFGGGLELAACADYRIAEAHIRIGQPESGLGIIAGWSGTQRAVRRFGSQAVRRMALMGETFTTDEALSLGIVDLVVPRGEGMDAARTRAEAVAARAPLATELTKMLINSAEGEERERIAEAVAGALAATSSDLREGVAAFKEKREAHFKGE